MEGKTGEGMKLIRNGRGTRKCKICGEIFEVYVFRKNYAHICRDCRKKLEHRKCLKMMAGKEQRRKLVSHDIKEVQKPI
jgi:hypothetical protein